MEHYQQRYVDNLLLHVPHKAVIGEDDFRFYQLNALQQISGKTTQTIAQPRGHDTLALSPPVNTTDKINSLQSTGECALDLTVSAKKRPLDDVYKENVQVKRPRYSFPTAQHVSQKTGLLQQTRIDLANQSNYIPNGHVNNKKTVKNVIYSPPTDIKQDKARCSLVPNRGELPRVPQTYSHSYNNVMASSESQTRPVYEHSGESLQKTLHNQHRSISGKRVCNQTIQPSGHVEYVSFPDTRPSLSTHNVQHTVAITNGSQLTSPNREYKQNVAFADSTASQVQQHPAINKSLPISTSNLLYRQSTLYNSKHFTLPEPNYHHKLSVGKVTQPHSPSHRSLQQSVGYKDLTASQSQTAFQYYQSNHIDQLDLRAIQSSKLTSVHPTSRHAIPTSILTSTAPTNGLVHQAFLGMQPPSFNKLIQQYQKNNVSDNSERLTSYSSIKHQTLTEKCIRESTSNKSSGLKNNLPESQTNIPSQNFKVSLSHNSWKKPSEPTAQRSHSANRVSSVTFPATQFDKHKPQVDNKPRELKTNILERQHSTPCFQNVVTSAQRRVPSPRSDCFSMLSDEAHVQSQTHDFNYKHTKNGETFKKSGFQTPSQLTEILSRKNRVTNEKKAEFREKVKLQQHSSELMLVKGTFPERANGLYESKIKQEEAIESPPNNVMGHRNAKSVIFDLLTKSNDKTAMEAKCSDEVKDQKMELVHQQSESHKTGSEPKPVNGTGVQSTPKHTVLNEKEIVNKTFKCTEMSVSSGQTSAVNSAPKHRPLLTATNASVGVPFSKKRIILEAVSKDKDLCKFIEDTACVRTINNVAFNPDSPEMPTLSPQQKPSNACTISPHLNEPPVLECLDSDSDDQAKVTTKIRDVPACHSANPTTNAAPGILSDGKGFFKRDTFPRRPSIMKVIPVANVAPMIKNKSLDADDTSHVPETALVECMQSEVKDILFKPEMEDENKAQLIASHLESDIQTLRSLGKRKKRRAAARTKRARKLSNERHQQNAVKLRSRSDLQRTIRRLKRSNRNEIVASKETGEDISGRITRSNRSIRLRRSTGRSQRCRRDSNNDSFKDFRPQHSRCRTRMQTIGSSRLPRYNRNAAYEKELKNEQTRNAQRKLKPRGRIRIVYSSREDEDNISSNDVFAPNEGDDTGYAARTVSANDQDAFQPKPFKSRSPKTWSQRRGARRKIRRHFTPRGCARIVQKSEYDDIEETVLASTARRSLFNDYDGSDYNSLYNDTGKSYGDFLRLQCDIKCLVVNKSLGETLLHKAVRVGNKEIVEYCLERDSHNVNAKDNAGYTPLHEACVTGNESIALMLLKSGSDINACSQDGIRPIHDAVENHHVSIVRLLLKYGADPTLTNYAGKSPLKLAKSHQMHTFLSGCLDDLNGTEDAVDVWQFMGSSVLDSERETEIFADMPSDPEDETDDLFQTHDYPQFSIIQLIHGKEQCLKEYIFIDDILQYFKIDYETFQKAVSDCQLFDVITVSWDEISDQLSLHTVYISKRNCEKQTFKMVLKTQWMANCSRIHSVVAEHRKLHSLDFTEPSDLQNNNTILFDKEASSQMFSKQQSVAVAPTIRPTVIKLMNRTNSNDGLLSNANTDSSELLKMTSETKTNSNSMWFTSDCYEMDHFRFKVGSVPNDCFELTSNQNCLKKCTALVRPCKDSTLMADAGSLLDVTY